jgi:hypothetical protein
LPANVQFAALNIYTDADVDKLKTGKLQSRYREMLVLNISFNLNNAEITEFSNWTGRGNWIPNKYKRRTLL